MDSLQALVNVLALLAVLSAMSERVTNVLKLRDVSLREHPRAPGEERMREHRIQLRAVLVGILLAILVKANLFEILARIESPWRTLGWVRLSSGQWFQSPSTDSAGTIAYTMIGCAFTGTALGLGAKFWHDLLGTVFELRSMARQWNARLEAPDRTGTEPQPAAEEGEGRG